MPAAEGQVHSVISRVTETTMVAEVMSFSLDRSSGGRSGCVQSKVMALCFFFGSSRNLSSRRWTAPARPRMRRSGCAFKVNQS